MKKLIELMNENPELEVVPLIDSDVLDVNFRYIAGEFLNFEVDHIALYAGHLWVHSDDDGQDLKEGIRNEVEPRLLLSGNKGRGFYTRVEKETEQEYKKIKWEKVIIMWIEVE